MTNNIKRRLASGRFIKAAWAHFGSPDVCEAMVRAGWDTILIDGEHGPGGIEDWVAMVRAVEAAGGEGVLRVPDTSTSTLQKVLDRGFRTLVVPHVDDFATAEAVTKACLFPPAGHRSFASPLVRASHHGARTTYTEEAADELCLLLQCEHESAVADLTRIAALPACDAIFIGPNDLAGSIGYLGRDREEEPMALRRRAEAAVRETGTPLATILGPEGFDGLQQMGYGFVVGPSDVALLTAAARAALADDRSADGY
jgi:4-hydroxy-2-oxoheptanedioate aldolase